MEPLVDPEGSQVQGPVSIDATLDYLLASFQDGVQDWCLPPDHTAGGCEKERQASASSNSSDKFALDLQAQGMCPDPTVVRHAGAFGVSAATLVPEVSATEVPKLALPASLRPQTQQHTLSELSQPAASGSKVQERSVALSGKPADSSSTASRSTSCAVLPNWSAAEPARPTIQTGAPEPLGVKSVSQSLPGTARRAPRTQEERTAHRMAKNRATAAVSRKRKQVFQADLLQRQHNMEVENEQLVRLLNAREAEIVDLRQQLSVVEMVGTPAGLPQQDFLSLGDDLHRYSGEG